MDANFTEDGFQPPTEVKDTLTPDMFHNPTSEARIHFYKSENSPMQELQKAVQAIVLIGEGPESFGGSGVIINFEGRKYLITATHVIGNLLAGSSGKPEIKYHYRSNQGQLKEGVLRRGEQLYDSTTARERGLEATDSAIFPFDGDNDGVEISDLAVSYEVNQIGSAIGFPGKFHDEWKDSIRPLMSVGYVFKNKPKEMTPYMQALMEKMKNEQGIKEEQDLKIYYTGRTMSGNSGGPLVDSQGKVLGVLSAPKGTLGKEDGIEMFSDFRPILKDITQSTANAVL